MVRSLSGATPSETRRSSRASTRRAQLQKHRASDRNSAIDGSVLASSVCWCSPIGRGSRLKIGQVGVRIPPPAPISNLRLSAWFISRRWLHLENAADLCPENLSQRTPAACHRRNSSRDFPTCPNAPRRARPNWPLRDRENVLGWLAFDVAPARPGQEAPPEDRARTMAGEARCSFSGAVRTWLYPLRRMS